MRAAALAATRCRVADAARGAAAVPGASGDAAGRPARGLGYPGGGRRGSARLALPKRRRADVLSARADLRSSTRTLRAVRLGGGRRPALGARRAGLSGLGPSPGPTA